MDRNFTLKNRVLILVTVLIGLFLVSVRIQAAPKIKFEQQLVSETHGVYLVDIIIIINGKIILGRKLINR